MRPVPAARSQGPHQLTLTGQLEALGYTVSPSPFSYKRRICRDGVEVGHFTVEDAFGLLPRRPVPTISADDALAALTAGVNAALGVPIPAPLAPLQARGFVGEAA